MTAEDEVDDDDDDDDEDIPDFRTLKMNTENAHLFMDPANGTTHFIALDSLIKIKHSSGMMCNISSCR